MLEKVTIVKTVKKSGVLKDYWGYDMPVDEVVGMRRLVSTGNKVSMIVAGGNGEVVFQPIFEDFDGVEYVCPPNVEGRTTRWMALTNGEWWGKLDEHRKDRFVLDGKPYNTVELMDLAEECDYDAW